MIQISQSKILERWDDLPMLLREAMYAPETSDTVWKICSGEHLSDEKIHVVAKIAGFVFMGLLGIDQIAKEIADELGLDLRVATSIANTITQRTFAPFRSDIDKIYRPVAETTMSVPKVIEEIRAVPKAPLSAPVPLTASATKLPVTTPPAPEQEPIKSAVEKTATSFDEFSRIGKNPAPAVSPAPAPAPKPFVLQTESVSRPIPNAPNFRVPTIAENIMGEKKGPSPLPTVSAVIEFGGMPIPKTSPTPQPPAVPKVSVVRYGSEHSAPPIMPPKPEPMRTITEITPETLKASMPIPRVSAPPSFAPLSQIPVPSPITLKPQTPPAPRMPVTPMPPKPPVSPGPKPASQPEKMVQKDYSQ